MSNGPALKKCPNCKTLAEELAAGLYHCPSCGAVFGEAVEEAPRTAEPGDTGPKAAYYFRNAVGSFIRNPKPAFLAFAIAIAVVVGILVYVIGPAGGNGDETEPTPETRVAEERTEANEPYTVMAPDGITLYSEPDLWAETLGVIPKDEPITVMEKREYWWRVFRADSTAGWILYRYENLKKEAEETKAAETGR